MPPTLTTSSKRIETIDLLRGIIMVIMALDHARDFFHNGGSSNDPLNPLTTTPILYFTRWITHFCAPTFVFLSGLSAWLQSQRKTKSDLCIFLIKRGFWLIIVDLVIMSLGITGDIYFNLFVLETLWSIGASMIVLGILIRLPFKVILSIGLVIFFGHNLLDFVEKSRGANLPLWWGFFHRTTFTALWGQHNLLVFYPFLPWVGVMLLGYCCGKLFTHVEPLRRQKILLWSGIGMILFFFALRAANVYGNPATWATQKTGLQTFFSFMNVQKYPPSLLFCCATIGPGLIFLALVKNASSRFSKIVSVYGRVPLFYFIVHFYILHIAAIIIYLLRGHRVAEGMKGVPGNFLKFTAPGEGYPLGGVYVVWLAIVIIMYPLCKWYDAYKTRHKEKWWLSYL